MKEVGERLSMNVCELKLSVSEDADLCLHQLFQSALPDCKKMREAVRDKVFHRSLRCLCGGERSDLRHEARAGFQYEPRRLLY